jgi:hypothetical protein
MNEVHDYQGFWWDILKTVSNVIGVALAVAFGWLTRKFTSLDERLDAMETETQKRTQESAVHIAVLQSYHVSNTQRLDSIEDTTQRMDAKLDRLIERVK